MATRRLFLLGASSFSENKQYSLCLHGALRYLVEQATVQRAEECPE